MDTTWLNLNDAVIAPLFHNLLFVLLIVIPMITMRSFSEEKSQSTFELLFTSPVRISEMVLGKYLAGAFLVTLMVALSFLFPAMLFWFGNPELGMTLAGMLALYLTALSFVAVGNFTSALTSNQIIATISALVILLLLFVINWPAEGAGVKVAGVLGYLSVSEHFGKMAKGVIETSDLVYFVSLTTVFLFLTHRAVESSRWK
jgi:ABC-2 type transport system permease protein